MRRDGCPKESSRSQFRNSRRSIEFNWIMVDRPVGRERQPPQSLSIIRSIIVIFSRHSRLYHCVTQRVVGREFRESNTSEKEVLRLTFAYAAPGYFFSLFFVFVSLPGERLLDSFDRREMNIGCLPKSHHYPFIYRRL